MSARALLERIDRIAEELERLRADVLHLHEDAPPEDAPADLVDENLLDAATAADRFNLPPDMVRRWCRNGCGIKELMSTRPGHASVMRHC